MQKTLIYLGVGLVILGLVWPWLSRLPLGRLPGDLLIKKPVVVYFPFTTLLLISLVLSVLLYLFRK